jgi:hypothetical protein
VVGERSFRWVCSAGMIRVLSSVPKSYFTILFIAVQLDKYKSLSLAESELFFAIFYAIKSLQNVSMTCKSRFFRNWVNNTG